MAEAVAAVQDRSVPADVGAGAGGLEFPPADVIAVGQAGARVVGWAVAEDLGSVIGQLVDDLLRAACALLALFAALGVGAAPLCGLFGLPDCLAYRLELQQQVGLDGAETAQVRR